MTGSRREAKSSKMTGLCGGLSIKSGVRRRQEALRVAPGEGPQYSPTPLENTEDKIPPQEFECGTKR